MILTKFQAPDASSVALSITDNANSYWNLDTNRFTDVSSTSVSDGSNTIYATTIYGYDANGNKTLEWRGDSQKAPTPVPLPQAMQVLTWTYDSYGNLTDTYEPDVRTHVTYSNGRMQSSISGYGTPLQRTTNYSWLNGMAVLSVTDADNGVSEQYQYDNAGRKIKEYYYTVVKITSTNAVYITNTYDGEGRRVKKTESGVTTYYVYDAFGRLSAEYTTDILTPGTSYSFTDMLGSVRAVTSSNGALQECYDYLPFGRMLSSADNGRNTAGCYPGSPNTTSVTSNMSQKFIGQPHDNGTGLDYFGARFYSASLGRFTSPDPVLITSSRLAHPHTLNLYAYANNNPLRYTDPTGMESISYGLPNSFANAENPWMPTIAMSGFPGLTDLVRTHGWTHEEVAKLWAALPNLDSIFNLHYFLFSYDLMNKWLPQAAQPPAPTATKGSQGGTANDFITCTGPARVSAVGPDDAKGVGALYSDYVTPSIRGGTMGTVAVPRFFLELDKPAYRQYGTQIIVSFDDNGEIQRLGGPPGPYTVSDWGDKNITGNRFDLYRVVPQENAKAFNIRNYNATVTFPRASGGVCPSLKDWRQIP